MATLGGAAAALLALVMVAAGVVYIACSPYNRQFGTMRLCRTWQRPSTFWRDNLGIPRIEAASEADLARAMAGSWQRIDSLRWSHFR